MVTVMRMIQLGPLQKTKRNATLEGAEFKLVDSKGTVL
ncbi:cell wall surface anchor family protein [Listeria seeligeri FSL S4-171]|nr:cell wall surface anchor family protein [Listeria seeligeri FSL S4-171]